MRVLPWNDLDAFAGALNDDIAAVIMEPVMCNTSCIYPKLGYLEGVRELCTRNGTVLIFDEVITGFRLGLGGAQGLLGITPDLAVFAKALANGFPGSCLAGRADILDLAGSGRVMHGGTYNSNVICTVAAIATIEELKNSNAYRTLNENGDRLIEGLRKAAQQHAVPLLIQGRGPVFHTAFTNMREIQSYRDHCRTDATRLSQFVELLLDEGVRITRRGAWFLSAAHTSADIRETVAAADRTFEKIASH